MRCAFPISKQQEQRLQEAAGYSGLETVGISPFSPNLFKLAMIKTLFERFLNGF